jgi:predicted ATPase with chaperone activity
LVESSIIVCVSSLKSHGVFTPYVGRTLFEKMPVKHGCDRLRNAMTELNFSARDYDRILKVAGTIVDLAGAENILSERISEAIQYRSLDRQLWT